MYSHLDTPPPKGVGPFVEKLTALGSILDADGVQSVTAPASKSQKLSAHSLLHLRAVRSPASSSIFNETDLVDEAVGGHDIAAGRYVHVAHDVATAGESR